ncbi:hypothetical protein GJ496_005061 [Pomphorhynchus laevis]|nr:hypothetical protein GJ496_005061 [Pomphorhynchus laevis]
MDEYKKLIKELDNKLSEHGLAEYRIEPSLNLTLCQLVYRWTMGDSFKSCMKLTEQQEGIVVKCIQRINDLAKEMQRAAKYLTCLEMVQRLDKLRRKIQRGVVFTYSLYSDKN